MPNVSEVYPRGAAGDLPGLLNAANLNDGPKSLTIASAAVKAIKQEKKIVLGFTERKEQLVCNKTNARDLGERYGDDIAGWIGKHIDLVVTSVQYQNKPTKGIRVAG